MSKSDFIWNNFKKKMQRIYRCATKEGECEYYAILLNAVFVDGVLIKYV